jgi:hypothetical protein
MLGTRVPQCSHALFEDIKNYGTLLFNGIAVAEIKRRNKSVNHPLQSLPLFSNLGEDLAQNLGILHRSACI